MPSGSAPRCCRGRGLSRPRDFRRVSDRRPRAAPAATCTSFSAARGTGSWLWHRAMVSVRRFRRAGTRCCAMPAATSPAAGPVPRRGARPFAVCASIAARHMFRPLLRTTLRVGFRRWSVPLFSLSPCPVCACSHMLRLHLCRKVKKCGKNVFFIKKLV